MQGEWEESGRGEHGEMRERGMWEQFEIRERDRGGRRQEQGANRKSMEEGKEREERERGMTGGRVERELENKNGMEYQL